MKKLIKFSALSLFIFASACFSLISCGKQNGGGNTQINLAGSRYVGEPINTSNEGVLVFVFEFQNGGKFEYKRKRENGVEDVVLKGNYNVEGKTVSLKVTWAHPSTPQDILGKTIIATLSDDGKTLTWEGDVFTKA